MLLSLVFSVGLCGAISLPDVPQADIPEVDTSIDVSIDMPEEISEADPSQTSMPEDNTTETDMEEDTPTEIPTIPTDY